METDKVNLTLGPILNSEWKKYNIFEQPLYYNNKPTPYKAIIKDGRVVAVTGLRYKLIPNELALEIANQTAEAVGAQPFTVPGRVSNVLFNFEKTRMLAFYRLPTLELDWGGRLVAGYTVYNSIDGSMGFGCSVFTFRVACLNVVWSMVRGLAFKFPLKIYHKHTAGLRLEKIEETIKTVTGLTKQLLLAYKKMEQIKTSEELLNKLVENGLPKKLLPKNIEEKTLWETYNDITAAIWHNQKTDVTTKTRHFNALHQTLLPLLEQQQQ